MRNILLLLLLLSCRFGYAQPEVNVELKTGYGAYAMGALRPITTEYRTNTNYAVKITDNFPAFVNFGASGSIVLESWEFGVDYTYLSTGARAHYEDYSGELGFDQLAKAHAISSFARYSLLRKPKFQLKASLALSYYISQLDMNQYFRIGEEKQEDRFEVVSGSVAMTPMAGSVFKITKSIYTGFRVGYCVDLKGGLHVRKDKELKLLDDAGDQIHTDWSGIRSEVFVGVRVCCKVED